MNQLDIWMLAIALAMDCFTVSIVSGVIVRRWLWSMILRIAFLFGLFQAMMPLIGWMATSHFSEQLEVIDHWIAFGLLAFIGGKMLIEAIKSDGEEDVPEGLDYKELFILAVATSIDALAVGVVFAFENVKIVPSVLIIGVTTFALSFIGVAIGNRFGAKYNKRAQIAGGAVLILLGAKILLEGLGIM
jgi:putative Mn2+ efflux pump MntP